MRVLVLTADPAFFTVAHGIAGAMGHQPIQAQDGSTATPADLLLIDAARLPGALPPATDPMRTAVFVGGDDEPAQRSAASALGAVFPRRELAIELPRIITDFAL